MSGMRTVSFFGPGAAETEGGRTEADKRLEAPGGFGGKKFVDEISSGAIDQKSPELSPANLAATEIAPHAAVATALQAVSQRPRYPTSDRPAATTWIKLRYARRS
jgi:hypothetical protein